MIKGKQLLAKFLEVVYFPAVTDGDLILTDLYDHWLRTTLNIESGQSPMP
jgi:hypothetical protein